MTKFHNVTFIISHRKGQSHYKDTTLLYTYIYIYIYILILASIKFCGFSKKTFIVLLSLKCRLQVKIISHCHKESQGRWALDYLQSFLCIKNARRIIFSFIFLSFYFVLWPFPNFQYDSRKSVYTKGELIQGRINTRENEYKGELIQGRINTREN